MHPSFQQYNPFRSTAWRSERVLELIEAQPGPRKPSRRCDDEFITQYRRFLLHYLTRSESQRSDLFASYPGIYLAHTFHHHPDTEWKAILQGLILAGCSDQDAAERLATHPQAVAWYERLFFAVRDRLGSHTWIVKTILGTFQSRQGNRDGTLTQNQRDLTYKLFGYFGGPLVLDAVIAGMNRGVFPRRREEVATWWDQTTKDQLRNKAAISSRNFEVNKHNVMQLFELNIALMAHESAAAAGGPTTDIERAVESFIGSVQWGLARRDQGHLTSQQRQYLGTAVEPRADEQLALALGEIPESLVAAVAELSPEPLALPSG